MKLILIGFMGAGKTSLGKALANQLNLTFVDTDELLEKQFHTSIQSFFSKHSESEFRKEETACLMSLELLNNCVVSTGGGLPIHNQNHLKKLGIIIYLEAQFETLMSRLKNDQTRPLLKSKTLHELKTLFNERTTIYSKLADITINTDNNELETCLNTLKTKLGTYNAHKNH